ncbi:tail-collar fiber protein [Pseudomonas sp. SJZ085]|uniref:phage tail protein n=1 Tax=unclassified Pseudomonas TaxID=196821 RepID=UPI0011995DBF|nr:MULTISPECIES: phage tail protein [unclassified Pseudomonas]TWC11013.1 tail-collar fiber protein [Pseudomonas sp. SJZ074]TWC29391.1 tail-collar fiber protein [Pseudomonas sp. SJZ085]
MADYYTLLTDAGIAYETACKAAGTPIKLSQISVGDGGGAVYNPAATATALKREVWRGPLNALFQDEKNPSWLLAEVTIPSDVGGWYVREAGIWTDTGILYAIVKYPESFKPVLATSGSGKEFYIRSIFETSNAELVTLLIDDTVVKATRAWVASYVADELAKLDRKQSVRVATTANIILSGAQTIDGVAVVAGDRVLVKSQTLAKDNGIYVAANGAWVRAKDADASVDVTSGLTVPVEEGATLANTFWQLITDGVIVLGATALTFQNVTQGFAPLNSPALINPTATTPPQFDSSTRVQTTAFAKRMGVEYSSFSSYSVNTSLTAAHVGGLHSFSNAALITAVLPSTTGVAQAATITLVCAGAGGLTIQAAAGDVVFTSNGVTGSLTLGLGDTAEFVRLDAQWRLIGGTMALKYGAVMSGPNWITQAQFDKSKAFATTEFVKRMGLELSNFDSLSTSTVLGVGNVGGVVSASSDTAITVTLPPAAMVAQGAMILVLCGGTGAVTLMVSSGDAMTNSSGSAISIVLGLGDSALMTRVSGEWRLISGTAAMRYSAKFAAIFGDSAHQVLPSGWTFKIGHASTNVSTGTVPVTFPVAFPNACMYVGAIYAGGSSATNPSLCQAGIPTRTGFTGYLTNMVGNNAAVTVGGYNWLAIGY